MTKRLRRGVSIAIIVFDILMVVFFIGDAFASGDFRLDFIMTFLFAVHAFLNIDYISYLTTDIQEEEQQENRIRHYESRVRYQEARQEEEFDTEELMELLQKKKEEYTNKVQ